MILYLVHYDTSLQIATAVLLQNASHFLLKKRDSLIEKEGSQKNVTFIKNASIQRQAEIPFLTSN